MKTRRCWSVLWLVAILASLSLVRCSCKEYPECDNDQECVEYGRGTPHCVDNRCVECRTGDDCEGCSECRNNACRQFACCADGDCPSGQICTDHRCVAGCRADDGCPDGFCVNERCVQCRNDADCPQFHACENNRCRDIGDCTNRNMDTVLFDFDSELIRRDQENALMRNVGCLNQWGGDNIRIEGHCDERGTDQYNIALGERRARSARDYMQNQGVSRDRISIISYGKSRPADPGSNERAWARNRRAEFVWR